ncbi:hypothetical protein [Pseudomonas saponiphila]|uniref:hypothetical protein n=1 Tax=Pseudomonas saponiphila TaxID=556534 RepID=UPI0022404929|nr:hypothetical protein [Pseudomonas saponiphila]
MRKPTEPGSPKSDAGQLKPIPAKPAPQGGPITPRQLGLSSREGGCSNKTVKKERRAHKQSFSGNAPRIYPPVVMMLDGSTDLTVGFFVTGIPAQKVMDEQKGDNNAFRTRVSVHSRSFTSEKFDQSKLGQETSKLRESWPHEVRFDAITPQMRNQIAECAKRESRLSPEVESVIAGVFRSQFLKASTTKKNAWCAVCQECSFLNIKLPSYSATADRLDVLFSKEVLRYY